MSVVSLRKAAQRPVAAFGRFSSPDGLGDEMSIVDLSHLAAEPSSPVRMGWSELPLQDADGRITGVLCQAVAIGTPAGRPVGIDADSAQVFVHDLANLLAVIDGGLRLLDLKTDERDRAAIIERLHRAVERGASMSRKLLDGARPPRSDRSAGYEHVIDIGLMLEKTLRVDVMVDTFIDPRLRHFRADPDELHRAVLNLCKNASDAMTHGGTIGVRARNVYASANEPWVEISVSDDGIGMPRDVLARAFEAYFTTKAAGKGTGLGLAQVKCFVERSNGTVSIESAENYGTTVRMLFPCL